MLRGEQHFGALARMVQEDKEIMREVKSVRFSNLLVIFASYVKIV